MAKTATARLPTIGAVIRAWRKVRGMTSTQLTERAGVRIAYLSEIEHDRTRRPQEDYLEKLADALEVPLEDILGRRMPPKDGGAESTPSSQQRLAGQQSQQATTAEDGDSQGGEEKEQGSDVSTYSAAHPAISLPLPSGTTGGKIDRLIASGRFSEEEEEVMEAALIEMIKRFISFKENQRMVRKED